MRGTKIKGENVMSGNLPKPIKKQREVLYMPSAGHTAVLGTAGSGKTTLALYRAAYLSEPSMPHAGRTLLLTFNKTLVTYLKYLKPIQLQNVQVETYHTFARGYLNKRGKMSWNCICNPDDRGTFISQAVKTVEAGYEPSKFFKRPLDFFSDEIQWIFSQGITSLDKYVEMERVGRIGTNLSRKLRPVMYEILEKYLEIRTVSGKLYDWDDIAISVRKEFEEDSSCRLYKHIIIDEGQDFSPEMIRSLAAAIPEDGSLSFFGDVAQQIYGQRMSWRSAGLNIPQQWFFKENYRNTKQIAQLGLAISRMPFFQDIPDLVEPTSPRADGTLPTLVECKDRNQQVEIALRAAKSAGKTQRVAILVKDREQEKIFSSALGTDATRLHRDLDVWNDGPGIYHGTYHAAKGLEFDVVIIPFLDADNLPDQDYIASHGEEDGLTHDGRLLYVAITRAKTSLILLYTGEHTSLLPADESLYQRVRP
jgi:superfamily I DNA/RNA helicase